jgi:hypothetical protein
MSNLNFTLYDTENNVEVPVFIEMDDSGIAVAKYSQTLDLETGVPVQCKLELVDEYRERIKQAIDDINKKIWENRH